jgi:hypothetical protein
MKKYILAIAIIAIAAVYVGFGQLNGSHDSLSLSTSGNEAIASAFRDKKSGVQVTGEGIVTKLLSDDNEGGRHQRFILRLASGQTLLVAHNIDIAPRLTSLKPGDLIAFKGLYEWNSEGGLIHWTHHDPSGQNPAGWLRFNGKTFQ